MTIMYRAGRGHGGTCAAFIAAHPLPICGVMNDSTQHDEPGRTLRQNQNDATLPVVPPPLAVKPRDAAAMLGISERTLWTYTNRGDIPCKKLGRCVIYPVDRLRDWLNGNVTIGKKSRRSA